MKTLLPRLALLLCLSAADTARAQGAINCDYASTPPEIAICTHPELRAFDTYLAQAYADVRNTVSEEFFTEVRASQKKWLKNRDAQCGGDVACLMEETQARTATLIQVAQLYAEYERDYLSQFPQAQEQAQGGYGADSFVAKDYSQGSGQDTYAPGAGTEPPVQTTAPSGGQLLSPREIYRIAKQSVVVVMAAGAEGMSQGSGVTLSENVVATNCHVTDNAEEVVVFFEGQSYPAQMLFGDERIDYCIIVTDGLPAQSARVAGLSSLEPGQRVYSIGSPKGFELTIAEGLLSGMREVEGVEMLQTSAPISSGSSGGGLFNEYGEVVGITTASRKEAQNINFALPVEIAYDLADNMLQKMNSR